MTSTRKRAKTKGATKPGGTQTAARGAQRRFKRERQIEVAGNAVDHADFEAFLAELQWFRDVAPRIMEFTRRYPMRGRELVGIIAAALPKTRPRRNEEECLWLAFAERAWGGDPSVDSADREPTKTERREMVLKMGRALGYEDRTIQRMLTYGRALLRTRQMARSK
jgi:hypothetical protein